MAETTRQTAKFQDYYLLLQVHPEADFAMIDAAYWHLARRYNQAAMHDSSARAKLDALNHAYTVLGSSVRREAYNRERNAVLGLGALPTPPPPPAEPMPLAVMERQRPLVREETPVASRPKFLFSLPQANLPLWQGILSAGILLVVASAALGAWTHPAVIGGLLVLGVAFSTLPLLGGKRPHLPKLALPSLAFTAPAGASGGQPRFPRDAQFDPDQIRQSMAATRERLRAVSPQAGASEASTEQGARPARSSTLDQAA